MNTLLPLHLGWIRACIRLNLITRSPAYHWSHAKCGIAFRLARHCQEDMAHFNNAFWRESKRVNPSPEVAAEFARSAREFVNL